MFQIKDGDENFPPQLYLPLFAMQVGGLAVMLFLSLQATVHISSKESLEQSGVMIIPA